MIVTTDKVGKERINEFEKVFLITALQNLLRQSENLDKETIMTNVKNIVEHIEELTIETIETKE